jgi:hypothetical protein
MSRSSILYTILSYNMGRSGFLLFSLSLCVFNVNFILHSIAVLTWFFCGSWIVCRSGFNLLFYGLGSKKDMLQDFARSVLVDHGAVVTVNGYVDRCLISRVGQNLCIYMYICICICIYMCT